MKKQNKPKNLTYLISVFVLLLMIVLLVPQADTITEGIETIKDADTVYLALAIAVSIATYYAAALTLQVLALRPINFGRTLIVQFASGFASKLVPAGIGGFALNTRYLVKAKHTVVQASSVMALNGVLGFAGHMLILTSSALFARSTLHQTVAVTVSPFVWLMVLVVASAALTSLLIFRTIQVWAGKTIKDLWHVIKAYKHRPLHLITGFLGTCVVTALFTFSLFACALSLGVHLTFLQVMLVYTAGAIGTAVVPTPGGIGGAEAALAAALIALGIDTPLAVSIAILFRLVTFWLPILPGFIFFQFTLRNRYI